MVVPLLLFPMVNTKSTKNLEDEGDDDTTSDFKTYSSPFSHGDVGSRNNVATYLKQTRKGESMKTSREEAIEDILMNDKVLQHKLSLAGGGVGSDENVEGFDSVRTSPGLNDGIERSKLYRLDVGEKQQEPSRLDDGVDNFDELDMGQETRSPDFGEKVIKDHVSGTIDLDDVDNYEDDEEFQRMSKKGTFHRASNSAKRNRRLLHRRRKYHHHQQQHHQLKQHQRRHQRNPELRNPELRNPELFSPIYCWYRIRYETARTVCSGDVCIDVTVTRFIKECISV